MENLRTFANKEISNGALKGKKLPTELKILNWGKNETVDGDVWLNDKTLEVFNINQKKTGRDEDVALDFGHNTVPGSNEYVQGEAKDIAAYGDPVLIKGDGLYLKNIEWTPTGQEKALNYKDLSPAVKTESDGTLTWLHSVGLVPNGAVKKLKFYSAKEFAMAIKTNSISDQGSSGANTTNQSMLDVDDYNKNGANAGVKKVGNDYEINTDMDDYDEHGVDCNCVNCMAANDPAVNKKHIKEYDSDDHFSKYGDVAYADKQNSKYPIDTKAHAKAAWSYINMPKNAAKYSGDKLSVIKSRIRSAAKKYGIDIAEDKTKTMSVDDSSFTQNVFGVGIDNQYKQNIMNDAIKKMAAEVGMVGETDEAKILFAYVAKYEGLKAEIEQQITKKDNTEEGGLKQFSAQDFINLKSEVEELKKQNKEEHSRYVNSERDNLIKSAAEDGKVIPLSADDINKVDISILRSIVANQPKNTVPLASKMKVLSADQKKNSREAAVNALNEQLVK